MLLYVSLSHKILHEHAVGYDVEELRKNNPSLKVDEISLKDLSASQKLRHCNQLLKSYWIANDAPSDEEYDNHEADEVIRQHLNEVRLLVVQWHMFTATLNIAIVCCPMCENLVLKLQFVFYSITFFHSKDCNKIDCCSQVKIATASAADCPYWS